MRTMSGAVVCSSVMLVVTLSASSAISSVAVLRRFTTRFLRFLAACARDLLVLIVYTVDDVDKLEIEGRLLCVGASETSDDADDQDLGVPIEECTRDKGLGRARGATIVGES